MRPCLLHTTVIDSIALLAYRQTTHQCTILAMTNHGALLLAADQPPLLWHFACVSVK